MDPASIVDALGYPAAGLGILIESAGVPFPGEALLLAAAALSDTIGTAHVIGGLGGLLIVGGLAVLIAGRRGPSSPRALSQ